VGVFNEGSLQAHGLGLRARPRADRRLVLLGRDSTPATVALAPRVATLVCMQCGYLRAPTLGDPHRTAATSAAPCPSCRTRSWASLADEDSVLALAEVERFEHADLDPRRRALAAGLRVAMAVALGVLVVTALLGAKYYAVLFSALAALFGIIFIPSLVISAWQEGRRRPRKLPYRWSLALPPATVTSGAPVASGYVGGESEGVAPLSGRRCLAWEVRVTRAGDEDTAAPALLVQRCADLDVAGVPLPGDRTLLSVPATVVPDQVRRERAVAIAQWLRERGILDSEGPWTLHETCIDAGDPVDVHRIEGRGWVLAAR